MSANSFSTLCFLCVTYQEQCVTFVVVLMGDGSLLVSQPASLPCWISGVDCFVVRGGLIQATSFRYNKSNRLRSVLSCFKLLPLTPMQFQLFPFLLSFPLFSKMVNQIFDDQDYLRSLCLFKANRQDFVQHCSLNVKLRLNIHYAYFRMCQVNLDLIKLFLPKRP